MDLASTGTDVINAAQRESSNLTAAGFSYADGYMRIRKRKM